MNKILVVGGAGYIGSHTVKKLLDNNYVVSVLDNLVSGHKEAVLTQRFFQVDIADKEKLKKIFNENQFDAIVHFAGDTYVGESLVDPQKYYKNNVSATLNLLECMLENNVKNLVFSSTCAIYGLPLYMPLDEKHSQNPINCYGQTKLIVEKILADYHRAYGVNYAALRYFNAAGADKDRMIGESHNPEIHLIPLILQSVMGERKNITVFGTDYDTPDGTCIRDYIHVEDLADAHCLALEKLFSEGGAYCLNLGTGIGKSVKEIIDSVERVTGHKVPVVYGERREGDPAQLYASNDLAKKTLGWVPRYMNIDDIIHTAWQWAINKKF